MSVIVFELAPTQLPLLVYVVVVIVHVMAVLLGIAAAQLSEGANVADCPDVSREDIVPE